MKKLILLLIKLLIVSNLTFAQSLTLASSASNPGKGTMFFNTTTNQLQYWNGTSWIPVSNANGSVGWSLSGSNIYASDNTSKVGIGTSNPTYPLSIQTPVRFPTEGYFYDHGMVQSDGNLKIGMGIYKAIENTNGTPLLTNRFAYMGTLTDDDLHIFGNGRPIISIYPKSNDNRVHIDLPLSCSQNLTIGALNGDAPLSVAGGLNGNYTTISYFNQYGVFINSPSGTTAAPISIVAEHGIWGGYIASYNTVTFSDARIKDIVGRTNSAEDLATLRNISVSNYYMKDRAQFGNKIFKKVIAQELEQVYPQAVSKQTSTIPDIYSLAEKVVFDQKSKNLTVFLPKNYGIQVGERIEMVLEALGKIKVEVVEVSANSFTVKNWKYTTEKIFVLGREVNDFRTVDYEAISMLGISAIQELAKENEVLKNKMRNYESRLETLESLLTKHEIAKSVGGTGKQTTR